jgi:hypothetical protein
MRLIAVAASIVALCAACAGGGNVTGERRNVGSVTVTFTATPSKARPGQPVRLVIRLVNNAGTRQTLTFPSGKKYDLWVTSGPSEVWRWSTGQMFTQEVTKQTLEGQTGVAFSESWTPSGTGTFIAHGELFAGGYAGDMKAAITIT